MIDVAPAKKTASGVPRERRPGILGPGIVAAASSNDPTTVATLAVIGATTGYGLCWLVVLVIPMLAIIQAVAASVGGVCRTSLQGAIRQRYGFGWAIVTAIAIVAVNVFTLAADVKAGSEAASLLTRLPSVAFVVPFAALVGFMLVNHSYTRIERYLSLLPIVFVCYAGSAVLARFDVGAFVHSVLVPQFTLAPAYVLGALALLGTTLTSYVYVWETIEVAERRPLRTALGVFRKDAVAGMVAVGVIFLFIVVACAATLGKHHLPIVTATDAAAALVPVAGRWAGVLFGIGLLASAILAVPVLAATNAYVISHTFGWAGSLDQTFSEARLFYGVVLVSLAVAAVLALLPVSFIAILVWASLVAGIATPLTLFFLVLIARDRSTMGPDRISGPLAVCAWCVTGIVGISAVLFVNELATRQF